MATKTKPKPLHLADATLEQIKARVEELGMNANQISIKLGGRPTKETVYKFLKGGGVNSKHLFVILGLLGWTGELTFKE